MGHSPVDISIQWRCTHCGHHHQQPVAVCMPAPGSAAQPSVVGAGSLVCRHCGQLGPIQVGCAIVLGLAVMVGSDGAVTMPWPVQRAPEPDRWVRDARHSSRN